MQQRVVPELVSSRGEIQLSDDGRPLRRPSGGRAHAEGRSDPACVDRHHRARRARRVEPRGAARDRALLAKGTRYRADEPIRDPHAGEALDAAKAGVLDFDTIADRLERRERDKVKAQPSPPSDPMAPAAQVAKSELEVHEEARLFHALSAVFRNEARRDDEGGVEGARGLAGGGRSRGRARRRRDADRSSGARENPVHRDSQRPGRGSRDPVARANAEADQGG